MNCSWQSGTKHNAVKLGNVFEMSYEIAERLVMKDKE